MNDSSPITGHHFDPTPLRNARHQRGLKLEDLAAPTQSSVSTVSRNLAGNRHRINHVPRPATVLGVPIDQVLISTAAAGDPAIAKPEAAA